MVGVHWSRVMRMAQAGAYGADTHDDDLVLMARSDAYGAGAYGHAVVAALPQRTAAQSQAHVDLSVGAWEGNRSVDITLTGLGRSDVLRCK